MSLAPADCPDAAHLEAHARHDLGTDLALLVDTHLRECRTCLERYVELGQQSPVGAIPDCHVVKELGRGRFGVVYKAWWLRGEPRLVALKILGSPGEMEKNRFEREIAVLKRIESPWIVKCLESGATPDALYYIMDYVEGDHLDAYLARSTTSLDEKLSVFTRVCRAVAHAHEQGVVHRDLKPGNILITENGEPHLVDFGICAVEEADWSSLARCEITHPGDVIGTLKYMSPEQAWGGVAGTVDHRSDIWALGIMLHEIVTGGGYPYSLSSTREKPAPEAVIERIRKELPKLPKLEAIENGRDLEVLLSRCLTWEREYRLDSAAALADDLDRFCGKQRIKTRPLWLPRRLKRLAVGVATRSRWACAAVFIAACGLIVYGSTLVLRAGWYATAWHETDVATAPAPGSEPRDDVLVVGMFDETIDAVPRWAEDHGIDGVTDDHRTWRGVHGLLMNRLAGAGPRALVWDFYFAQPRLQDRLLADGVLAMEANEIPVVLAAQGYLEDGTPQLSPHLVEFLGDRLRHGAIAARHMVERPGEFTLAVRRPDGTVIPSLALATFASVLHPTARTEVDWVDRSEPIELHYEGAPGLYLRESSSIEFTRAFRPDHSGPAIRKGDWVASSRFALATPEQWEARTVPYETLLACSDEELASIVRGKLLLVGDMRQPRFGAFRDRHPVKYRKGLVNDVPGCFLLADAVSGMLQHRFMRFAQPLGPRAYALLLIAALVGVLIPIRLTTRPAFEQPFARQLLFTGLAGTAAACFVMMNFARDYGTVHAGMVGFSLVLPMAGSFWVEFTRDRHRLLDRNRRAILGIAGGSDGTVILEPKRPKSLLAAR